jgi:hypothetical protein
MSILHINFASGNAPWSYGVMKTFLTALAILLALAAAGTARCHAQSDPDCTPSAQKVIRDLQTDGTFSDDQTMQDIMAYAIAKCSDNSQTGSSGSGAVRSEYDPLSVVLAGVTTPRVLPAPLEPGDAQLKVELFEKTCGVDAQAWNASCQKWRHKLYQK